MLKRSVSTLVVAFVLVGALPSAHAAMAVVDVRAITQLRSQIRALEQQLQTARQHLSQAQAEYQALTGNRGMEQLLSGTARNYLPTDWAALDALLRQTSGAYHALAGQITALVEANAVLSPTQLARLSAQQREHLETSRRSAALLQATTRQALETTSARFDSLQQLITAIGGAQDPKAVLDLQARIAAEQAMLQNENTKLMLLQQASEAEARAREQRTREMAIANIGSLRAVPPIGLND